MLVKKDNSGNRGSWKKCTALLLLSFRKLMNIINLLKVSIRLRLVLNRMLLHFSYQIQNLEWMWWCLRGNKNKKPK